MHAPFLVMAGKKEERKIVCTSEVGTYYELFRKINWFEREIKLIHKERKQLHEKIQQLIDDRSEILLKIDYRIK